MKSAQPRVVVVTRKTGLDLLVARHGTKGQAEFFLKSRQQSIAGFARGKVAQEEGLAAGLAAIPPDRRRVLVDRDAIDRFVFEPDDVILAVGQDGLVANVAKYLDGQTVIGVNPDPRRYDGVLCTTPPHLIPQAIRHTEGVRSQFVEERRAMVRVQRDDGLELRALNELFVGQRTHQSAVYTLEAGGVRERQSSSGLLVSTGTGSTGWARSIARQRGLEEQLPGAGERRLAWFSREPFPSVATGVDLDFGVLEPGEALVVTSEMGEGGTIFGDGVESDAMEFSSGQVATISLAPQTLVLLRFAPPRPTRTQV